MKSILKLILMIGVPALALVGYTNCSPTAFEAYRSTGAASSFKSAPTYNQLRGEYGSNPGIPTPDLHKITVDADQVAQCAVGEWDLIEAAIVCRLPSRLIISALNQATESESVIFTFPLDGSLDSKALAAQLLPAISATISGATADIFLCIDSNGNGKCTDEPIADLNTLSAMAIKGLNGATRDYNQQILTTGGLCGALSRGAVFFHKSYKFGEGTGTTGTTVTSVDFAAIMAQDILKNIESSPTTTTNGTVTNFPIRLGKADATLCPVPSVRTDGCFAKGTNINVTKELSVAIETLHVGSPVYMADGRTRKITRVVAGPEKKPMITFAAGGHKITVTTEHPLITDKGLRLAKDIGIGEQLKTADGKFASITSISAKDYKDLVYNFEFEGTVEADHLIIAEGLISGDLYLQNKLSKESAKTQQLLSANGSQH